jgi:hypothetical protein
MHTPAPPPGPPPPPGPIPPPVHCVSPGGHSQVPLTQPPPVGQRLLQLPQSCALVCKSTQPPPPPPPPGPIPPPPHIVSPAAHMLSQTPPTHWCPAPQRLPHAPQLAASLCRSLQRPGAHCVRPASQAHAPFTQLPPVPHWVPHAPQSNAFEVVSTHAPPQSVSPLAQETAHADCEQTWPVVHAAAQAPQLRGSLVVSVQTPPQRSCPVGQPHTPAVHDVPPRQRMPQPPQLLTSELTSTHANPHCVWSGVHCVLHAELEQTCPLAHAFLHAPQSAGSDVRSTQPPPQSVSPSGHVAVIAHWPSAHTPPWPQTLPHAPQFSGSLLVSTQPPPHAVSPPPQPPGQLPFAHAPPVQTLPHAPQLLASVWGSTQAPLQSVSPAAQLATHFPDEQTLGQELPHAPQLLGSDCRSTHAPLHESCPVLHVDDMVASRPSVRPHPHSASTIPTSNEVRAAIE